MTSLAMRDRTQAFSSREDCNNLSIRTGQTVCGMRLEDNMVFTLVPADDHLFISGGTLLEHILILWDACLLPGAGPATSSLPPLLTRIPERLFDPPQSPAVQRTLAQEAIAEIRAISGLTNEEIAPLAGVSRRSVQAWTAGEVISARKEQRLRALLDTIRQLAAADPKATRRRLLDRALGEVSPYDLLAEGRFNAAVDVALGRQREISAPATPQAHDLYAQLSHIEDRVELLPERLDRRFSGRLGR